MRIMGRLFIMCLTSIVLIGCADTQSTIISCPSTPTPPADAEGITKGVDPQGLEVNTFYMRKSTEFILSYYKKVLSNNGWKLVAEDSNGARFSYPKDSTKAICSVDVLADKVTDGRIRIRVSQESDQ